MAQPKRQQKRAKQVRRTNQRAQRRRQRPPTVAEIVERMVRDAEPDLTEGGLLDVECAASEFVAAAYAEAMRRFATPDGEPEVAPLAVSLQMLEELRDARLAPAAMALVTTVRAMDAQDADVREHARRATEHLQGLGAQVPAWSEAVARPQLASCWAVRDAWSSEIDLLLGFGYEGDERRHAVSVLIDVEDEFTIVSVHVADDVDEAIASVREAHQQAEDGELELLRIDEVEPAWALAQLADAVESTWEAGGETLDEDGYYGFALAESRMRRMAEVLGDGALDDVDDRLLPSDLDDLDEAALLARFTASPQFAAEGAASATCAAAVVAIVVNEVTGGSARFSPVLARLVLLGSLPDLVEDPAERAADPEIALATVRAWAAFTHDAAGLPAAALDAVQQMIEACRDEHATRMATAPYAASSAGAHD